MIWKTLRHPNVLPLLDVEMTGARFAMVSEWMENGNISKFLKHVDADRLKLVCLFYLRYLSSLVIDGYMIAVARGSH